jgi:predicted nuclease with TOPRIM domain
MEDTITKLTPELVEEVKELQAKIQEMQEKGIYSINQYEKEAQITREMFDANFSDYSVEKRNCDEYPYEKVATLNGFTFTALYTEEVR